MDQGLRITVGNEMYFDGSRPRSPRDDPRSRLGPRMDELRYNERIDDHYKRLSGPPLQPQYNDHRPWNQENWGRRPSPDRSSKHFSPPRSDRPKFDDLRGYHSKSHWNNSPEKVTYNPDVHRKYAERRSRSISPRGRSPYRKRSPSPYGAYSKSRHKSGSRSPLGKDLYSRSPHHRAEDLFESMYCSHKDSRSYAHTKDALGALRESYDYEKGDSRLGYLGERKSNKVAADDEEAYLYGDDSGATRFLKETKRDHYSVPAKVPEPAPITKPAPIEKKEAVTPGGFDTNALKNVLKAIGFDFELSAQSLQKAATAKDSNKADALPSQTSKALKKPEEPIIQPQPSVSATPADLMNPNAFQHSVQAGQYIPQNILAGQDPSFFFNQAAALQYANMGIPASVAQQMLYQPGVAQNTIVPIMQPSGTSLPLTVPDRPNLKVVPTISVEDKEKKAMIKSAKALEEEKRIRKKRLDYLEIELKNLKKKQAELIRKKKKQMNSTDREEMRENTMLQAGVVKQIREIREAAERAAGIRSSSSGSESDESSGSSSSEDDDVAEPNYIDGGHYLCRDCNLQRNSLGEFLLHLQSKSHRKLMDPQYKPWYKPIKFKKKSSAPSAILKGAHFLIPINGFYCKLCKLYSGDSKAAEEHCKTTFHNQKYEKFCKKNPDYEKEEEAAIQNVAEKLKKLKQEQQRKTKESLLKSGKTSEGSSSKDVKLNQKDDKQSKNGLKDRHYKPGPQKEDKYYNDRKPHYTKPPSSPGSDKSRDFAPELPVKYKYRPDDAVSGSSSRSSSRMRERSPKDPRLKGSRDYKYDKHHGSHDDLRYRKSLDHPPPPRKRSRSPYGGMYSDRIESEDQYKYPDKRRYEDSRKVTKDDRKNAKQRKSQWSPGYDELEERREDREQREKEKKKSVSPDKTFGKFTWKKVEKGKPKKNSFGEGAESSGERTTDNKFSLKIEPKISNTIQRPLKSRSGFGTFAPHTKILTSQRQDSESPHPAEKTIGGSRAQFGPRPEGQKRYKKPVEPVPPPVSSEKAISPAVDKVLMRKKSFEPPPPGTEGTEDIFQGSDDEDIASDVSGISMEIGSDVDN